MNSKPPTWSKQYTATTSTKSSLQGDKIILPASALEQLLSAYRTSATERTQRSSQPYYDHFNSAAFHNHRQVETEFEVRDHLPQPLTFKLVNPSNARSIYAGVREFSAEEDQIVLSTFLEHALGITKEQDEKVETLITVVAKQLSKGTFVKLRPLEAGYDTDWKPLLEQYLRANFTTLTNGEILTIHAGISNKSEEYRFLIDGFQPETDGICIVDTDLEVDIEALNEEQARETLKRIAGRLQKAPGTQSGSSAGGSLDIFTAQQGQVLPGEYVDYTVAAWDRTQPISIELDTVDEEEGLNLFLSSYSSTQRSKPRLEEHMFSDISSRPAKRIRLESSNAVLEHAEALFVSVQLHPWTDSASSEPRHYTIRARHPDPKVKPKKDDVPSIESIDEVRCANCLQMVPKGRMVLHENFCLRNNMICPKGCGQVFQKRSPEYQTHWHCPYDDEYGNTIVGHTKHNDIVHPQQVLRCDSCETQETFAGYPALAQHHTTNCPSKLILCRFCHLELPQGGDPDRPSAEVLLSGMTEHELQDGARTTECHMCGKIVRLRDMETHLKSHDLDRLSRPPPQPCRNINCGRTLDTTSKNGDTRAGTRMGQGPGNDIGLCNVCFGPLYVSMHDPENKALRRRIERRYLQQLLTGCGRVFCKNEYCKAGRSHLNLTTPSTTKDALPMTKPFVDASINPFSGVPLHFCTDEGGQRRRGLAEMMAAEEAINGGYAFEWCLGALEAEGGDLDSARQWLKNWAPHRNGM